MIGIDDLLKTLFQDVADAGRDTTPGELVRSSLAGQMPSGGPSGGGMSLPMALGGPRGLPRVPGPPPVPGPSVPGVRSAPAPTQVAQAPNIPGNALTDFSQGYSSGGLIGAIGNLMQGPETRSAMAQQYQRQQAEAQAQQNMTINAIRARYKDMPPEMAAVIARDSKLLQEYLGPQKPMEFDIIQAKDGTVLRVPKTSGEAQSVYKPDAQQAGRLGDPKDQFEVAQKLRKEFAGLAKPYFDVRDAYNRVEAATKEPSAAGDLALVFNFMKMLDPGSVVREGEFATARNAAGIPDRIRAWYNKILSGEDLAEAQRADFLNQARKLYKAQEDQFKKIQNEFEGISNRLGLNRRDTIVDFGRPTQSDGPAAPSLQTPVRAQDKNGNVIEWNGTEWVPVQ